MEHLKVGFDIVAECFAAPHKRRIVPLVGNRSKIKLDFTSLPRPPILGRISVEKWTNPDVALYTSSTSGSNSLSKS